MRKEMIQQRLLEDGRGTRWHERDGNRERVGEGVVAVPNGAGRERKGEKGQVTSVCYARNS